MKLTSANIALARHGQILRDETVPGLHVKVGVKRAYYLYYKTKDRRERRPKLGTHPIMTLGQARTIARELLLKVAMGEDPSGEQRAKRDAPTVADLVERFAKAHLPRRKAGTAKEYRRVLDTKILPALGKRRVADIDHEDVEKLHARIGKSAPTEANRTLAVASKMFSLAEKWQLRPLGTNPCQHVERFPENQRKRYLSQEEAGRMARALAELRPARPLAVDFLMLLALTGARKGELAAARWEHYLGDRLELPRELVKNEARTIFLPPPARAIIDALPRTSGTILQIKDPRATWDTMREMTGLRDLRIHDLRHSYASVLLDQGYGLEQIGQLLGHSQTQTTKRYAHLMDTKAIEASGKAGGQLMDWMNGAV